MPDQQAPKVGFETTDQDDTVNEEPGENFIRNVPGKTATPHPGDMKDWKLKQAEIARERQQQLSRENLGTFYRWVGV